MINELIESADLRAWTNQVYNDWAADFAKRSDPDRIFPLAIIPNTDPLVAAAEVRRCAKLGLRGGDLAFKRLSVPLYHRGWDPLWEAAQECRFPISFHSTGFKGLRAPDTPQMEKEYAVPWRIVRASLFQLDGMEVLVSVIASGACERYPDFKFVLGESGVTWIPYVFDRLDTEYEDRGRSLGFSLKPSDYFRRQGYTTYQQDQYLEPAIPIVGEDNIIWGADYPHPDCLWPDSRRHLEKNLGGLPERVRRKITRENVAKLYQLPSAAPTAFTRENVARLYQLPSERAPPRESGSARRIVGEPHAVLSWRRAALGAPPADDSAAGSRGGPGLGPRPPPPGAASRSRRGGRDAVGARAFTRSCRAAPADTGAGLHQALRSCHGRGRRRHDRGPGPRRLRAALAAGPPGGAGGRDRGAGPRLRGRDHPASGSPHAGHRPGSQLPGAPDCRAKPGGGGESRRHPGPGARLHGRRAVARDRPDLGSARALRARPSRLGLLPEVRRFQD